MAKHRNRRSRTHRSGRSLTIAEFCELHGISRSTYYALRAKGFGPREMRIGSIIRITDEANRDWKLMMESGGAPGSPSTPNAREKKEPERDKPHGERSKTHSHSKSHRRSALHKSRGQKHSKRDKTLKRHENSKRHASESRDSSA